MALVGDSYLLGADSNGNWLPDRAPLGVQQADGSLVFDTSHWPIGDTRFDLAIVGNGGLATADWLKKENLPGSALVKRNADDPRYLVLGATQTQLQGGVTVLEPLTSRDSIDYTGPRDAVSEWQGPSGGALWSSALKGTLHVNQNGGSLVRQTVNPQTNSLIALDNQVAPLSIWWSTAWTPTQGVLNPLYQSMIAEINAAFSARGYVLSKFLLEHAENGGGQDLVLDPSVVPDIASRFLSCPSFVKALQSKTNGMDSLNFYLPLGDFARSLLQQDVALAFGTATVKWVASGANRFEVTITDIYDFDIQIPNTQGLSFPDALTQALYILGRDAAVLGPALAMADGYLRKFKVEAMFTVDL